RFVRSSVRSPRGRLPGRANRCTARFVDYQRWWHRSAIPRVGWPKSANRPTRKTILATTPWTGQPAQGSGAVVALVHDKHRLERKKREPFRHQRAYIKGKRDF